VKLISDDPAFRKPDSPDVQADLDFLGHRWGEAYLISAEGGWYTAIRRDGRGGKLADPDRDGLCVKIRSDYDADPVSRELP